MRANLSGMRMLGAAVLSLAIAIGLMTHHDVSTQRSQTELAGVALANAVSRVPFEQLMTTGDRVGLLPLIRATQSGSSFAYASVARPTGEVLEVVSRVGAIPPGSAAAADPSEWNRQRYLSLSDGKYTIWEIEAPIVTDGELAAVVRIGFHEIDYLEALLASTAHGVIALLIFISFPAAYFWMRHELIPLAQTAMSLPADGYGQGLRIEPNSGPAEMISTVVTRLREFSKEMDERTESMRRERIALLASSKVASHERNRLRNLIEAVPDAVLGLASDGKVVVANARAEAFLRRGADELIGSAPASWSPSPELVRLIGRYTGSNGSLKRAEVIDFSTEGVGTRSFQASLHPVAENDGMALVIRDVTAENAARETQAEFLAHMAHELKAPLNVISMYGESLLGPDGNDETGRIEACNVIADEVDRLNGLIHSIFSIGRIESGHVSVDRQRVRTREFLTDVFESTTRDGDELGLKFSIELPDPMEAIFVDKQLMSVAIKNLITNAVKYNRPGGKVTLIAEDQEIGLLIRVVDTGVGIHEEDLEQVFDKFYRSEDDSVRKVTGHGLGLALVKDIIALHGGEIRVSSELGQGSEFSLFFRRNSPIFREDS